MHLEGIVVAAFITFSDMCNVKGVASSEESLEKGYPSLQLKFEGKCV